MKEISEEDKKRLFGYLQQHLVCFGFCYAHEPNAEGQSESFVAVSGFIIEFNDKWWLVTAGHIHTEFESLHKEKKITRRALFDGFPRTQWTTIQFHLIFSTMIRFAYIAKNIRLIFR